MHERENEPRTTGDRLAVEGASLRLGPTKTSGQVDRASSGSGRFSARLYRASSRGCRQLEANQEQPIPLDT